MICDDKAACRAIDEELGKGGNGEFVARLMTLRGFAVTADTVREHKRHAVGASDAAVAAKTPKDMARAVRDKALEMFEGGKLTLDDKDHVPGITAGLKAQAELNKQAAKIDDRKTMIGIAYLLAGHQPPEHLLIGEGTVIDGEAREVEE